MARTTGLTLTGDWNRMRFLVDPKRFDGDVRREMRKATRANAMIVAREMRSRITDRRYAANAELTVSLKNSDLPLADHGTGSFQAITATMLTPDIGLAGVLRTAPAATPDALPPYNVGAILHEGAVIDVTPRMRMLFQVLSDASRGVIGLESLSERAAYLAERIRRPIAPLAWSTTQLVIPPRPWIREVIEDSAVREGCRRRWEAAYDAALRAKGGT